MLVDCSLPGPTVTLEAYTAMEKALPECVAFIAKCEKEGGDACAKSQLLCNSKSAASLQQVCNTKT